MVNHLHSETTTIRDAKYVWYHIKRRSVRNTLTTMQFLGDKPMQFIVPALLFIALAPSALIEFNPLAETKFRRTAYNQSYMGYVISHAAVFLVALIVIRMMFPKLY